VKFSYFGSDVVIDPFAGGGTTCVAALKSKRAFVGFELSQEYVTVARKRINQILRKTYNPPDSPRYLLKSKIPIIPNFFVS